jgi:hypothetical protein
MVLATSAWQVQVQLLLVVETLEVFGSQIVLVVLAQSLVAKQMERGQQVVITEVV